jgi:hypothetical protein
MTCIYCKYLIFVPVTTQYVKKQIRVEQNI